MAHLIDKDAVIAEIERLRKKNNESENVYDFGTANALESILSFIDTLEVKEVDLEKEYKDFIKKSDNGRSMLETAKYFFELGLKAKRGE